MHPDATLQTDTSAPKVLLIDDSIDVHRLLTARLQHEEIELIGVVSGEEGVRAVHEHRPSLVLLDLDMPAMDGFEVLRTLKDDMRTMHIPVIILSGLGSPQDKVAAFDLGAIDYITKPFDLTELRARMRSAIQIYQLLELLSRRAQIDGLTGLWNRAHFDARWREAVAQCSRHGHPLSIAIFDLDHFKSINDTHGHPAGDAVLQGFARTLRQECRAGDIPCRYGGEEFVLIMPDTAPTDAKNVCERIRAALSGLSWPRHPDRAVTASAGIAGTRSGTGLSPGAWLEAADQALYASKQGGRDRLTVADISGTGSTLAKAG